MTNTSAKTSGSSWLTAHSLAVFAFLYLPIAVLILYSFNGQGIGGFPHATSRSTGTARYSPTARSGTQYSTASK